MTTTTNYKMVFCKDCVNCMRVSSLNSDVVLWDCNKGRFSGITQTYVNSDGLVHSNSREFGFIIIDGCDEFDSGSYNGGDKEKFKEIIGSTTTKQRKVQKFYDYYEGKFKG